MNRSLLLESNYDLQTFALQNLLPSSSDHHRMPRNTDTIRPGKSPKRKSHRPKPAHPCPPGDIVTKPTATIVYNAPFSINHRGHLKASFLC